MKKVSEHLGQIIISLACIALLTSAISVFHAPISGFFSGITDKLTTMGSTVLGGLNIDFDIGVGGGAGGSYGEVPENVGLYYSYSLVDDNSGYKAGLTADFKTALNNNTDYVVDGETLWTVGSALPNPGSMYNDLPVVSMAEMFKDCTTLTELDLSGWDTSNVTDMTRLFANCNNLTSVDVSNFDTSNVTSMRLVFSNCKNLTTVDVSNWDTSNVTDMAATFQNCDKLTELDVSNWDTSKVETMQNMFKCASYSNSLQELDVSGWDTSKVTNMAQMFYLRDTNIDVSNWDVSKVTTFDHMFAHSKQSNLDVSEWVTSSATNMYAMFHSIECETIDVSKFDTSNVIAFGQMFENTNLKEIKGLENFDTSKGLCFGQMFASSAQLTELDLSSFDTRKAKVAANIGAMNGGKSACLQEMFAGTHRLQKVTLGENFRFNGDGSNTNSTYTGILPTQNSTYYIPECDGNWYAEDGTAYTAEEIQAMENPAGTYYAIPR